MPGTTGMAPSSTSANHRLISLYTENSSRSFSEVVVMPGPVSRLLFCLALALGAFAAHAKPLTLDIYNPGSDAIFPVTSVLIAGEKELILVDAQFEKKTRRGSG